MLDIKNKVIEGINRINEKNPFYLVAGVVFAVLVIDYFAVLQFQLKTLGTLTPQIASLTQEISSTKTHNQRMPQYQKELTDLKAELALLNQKLKTRDQVPVVLENISKMANQNGVRIEKIIPGSSDKELLKNSEGKYFSIPINIEAISGYHDFGRFLNQLETEEVFLTVPEFTLSPAQDDTMRSMINLKLNAIVFEKVK